MHDVIIILLWQYYGHRAKLQVIQREGEIELLNRQALRIARQVADKTGTLMAGNICNTGVYDPQNKESADAVHAMFKVSNIYLDINHVTYYGPINNKFALAIYC